MALNFSAPETTELKPRILVFGVGGAGGNAVNNMIEAELEGVDFAVANTDAQALSRSKADRRIQLGAGITEGLGAGARPEIGEQSAEDSLSEITEHLHGAHMVFITAGMGGGTGTGGAPVIARAAREQGILTVGVVTKPFQFEGSRRMKIAESGIEKLQEHVDTLIIIPNQNLFRIATEKTTFAEAFGMADQVLHSGVRGITDLMVMPGLINLDFADVRTVMNEMGKAMMGTGEASGEKRAIEAAHNAINNPLLDDVSMKGAQGVLINITGGMDMTLYEVDEAANEVRNEVDPEANIIVGSTFDDALEGSIRVSVVATGIDVEELQQLPGSRKPVTKAQSNVTPAWQAREAKPQAEPFVRRTVGSAATNMSSMQVNSVKTEETNASTQYASAQNNVTQAKVDTAVPTMSSAPTSVAEQAPAVTIEKSVNVVSPASISQTPTASVPIDQSAIATTPTPLAPKPAIVETQERLQREISTQMSPNAHAIRDAKPAKKERGPIPGFSLFGRRPKSAQKPDLDPLSATPSASHPVSTPIPTPEPQQSVKPQAGDLFGNMPDESELEIPAFLRRQAN